MVLNESELFTLHTPCLLMNTSILFGKIVLPSCGIFFNAVSSKWAAGKPWTAKTTSPTSSRSAPHPSPAPAPTAHLRLALSICFWIGAGAPRPRRDARPAHLGVAIRVRLEAGGLKLRRVRALSSVWKGTKRWAKVPQELKSSAGCLIGCVASGKG